MGLVDRIDLHRRLASRADPTTLEEFGALLGRSVGFVPTRTGITITDQRALGITAWYSGVRYLAETIAFLPVHTFKDTGPLAKPRRERRADPPWVTRPDVELPWGGWAEFAIYSLLHRSNSYSLKLRNGASQVTGLRPIHPDNVKKQGLASDGTKVFEIKADDGERIPLTTREILHIPGLSTDGKFGYSTIRAHAESLGIVAAADEAAARYYANASHPAGILEMTEELSKEEADRLKEEWEKFHRGLANRERIGVLSKGARYNPISINASDAQLLQARQFGVTEVSRILRIPPHKLYDLSRATFSNIEHQAIEAVTDSVRPLVERLEEWVNFDRDLLVGGNFIEIQIEGLLRGDTITRYRSYALALGGHPWMMPSEPRRLENLPEVDDTDFIPHPLNLGAVGEDPMVDDPPNPGPDREEGRPA